MAFWRLITAFQPDPALTAYNEGVKAYERKEYPAARQAFSAAVEKDPTIVAGWMNLALTELELAHLPEAEKAARKAIELIDGGRAHGVPSGGGGQAMKAQAYAHLSLALSRQNRHSEALVAIRHALRTSPENPKAATWRTVETELARRK
jgi:tetratricopeptide (TPR) repeat protein